MRHHRAVYILRLALTAVAAGAPMLAQAEGLTHTAVKASEPQRLELVVGKSIVIDIPSAIKRASLANPDIADTVVLSPKQIYITGKGIGVTNLTLWEDSHVHSIFDLAISPDSSRLQEQLSQLLPGETQIHVWASHDHLTLSGLVSGQASLSQAASIAEAYAPKKIINLLQVSPEPTFNVDLIKGAAATTVKFAGPH